MALDQPFLTAPTRPFLRDRGNGRARRAQRLQLRLRAGTSRRQLLRRALQRSRLALAQH